MVREQGVAPPSRIKRLIGWLKRLNEQLQLVFSWVADSQVMELAELQLRLGETEMAAVNRMRAGADVDVIEADARERCFVKLSVELYAVAWIGDDPSPSLVGLEQITDIGVMSNHGDFRSWLAVDTAYGLGPGGPNALRHLMEAQTLDAARASIEAAAVEAARLARLEEQAANTRMSVRGSRSSFVGGNNMRERSRSVTPSALRAAMSSRLSRRTDKDDITQTVLAPEDDNLVPGARKAQPKLNARSGQQQQLTNLGMGNGSDAAGLPPQPDAEQAGKAIMTVAESFTKGTYPRERTTSRAQGSCPRPTSVLGGSTASTDQGGSASSGGATLSGAEASMGSSSSQSTRPLEARGDGLAAAAVFAGSGQVAKRSRMQSVRASTRGMEAKRVEKKARMYITYRTPQNHARYVLFDINDYQTLYAWLAGLDALCKMYIDIIECKILRPSMMPWMRAVFTSVVETERKARGAVNRRSSPTAIAIGARSIRSAFGVANLVISIEQIPTLLRRVFESKDERLKKQLLKKASEGGELSSAVVSQLMRQRVTFIDFQAIMKEELMDERIGALWRQYAIEGRRMARTTGGGRMTLPEWLQFNHSEQHDSNDEASEAAFRGVAGETGGLTQLQFQWMLLGSENTVLDRARLGLDHEAAACSLPAGDYFSQPIGHYWVSCSHNTFLDGDQLNSHSTPDMYRRVMLEGCRSVEIDCWDGNDGEPIVTHGNTACTKTKLKLVLAALMETAFVFNELPVFISIEMHCCAAQQQKCAQYMRQIFGSALLMPEDVDRLVADGGHGALTPRSLSRKILVKGKMSKRPVEARSKGSWADPKAHGALALGQVLGGDGTRSMESSEEEEEDPGAEEEDDDSEGDEEEGEDGVIKGDAAAEDERSSKQKVASPTNGHRSSKGSPGKGSTGGAGEDAAPKAESPGAAAPTMVDAMVGVKAGKKKKKGRYVDPAMEKVTTVRSKPVDYVMQEGPVEWPMPITSISEKDITELTGSEVRVQKLQRSFQQRLSRIYPRGTRINSSNMLPLDAWRAGAHMVALNYQTNDLPVQLNRAFFQRAAANGYILKPPAMLAAQPAWPQPRQMVRCVTIKLLSLHQLPSRKEARPLYEPHHRYVERLRDVSLPPTAASVSSPALTVEVFAVGGYHCVTEQLPPPSPIAGNSPPTRLHTIGVGGDGLHPHFDMTVHCVAAEPKETMLRIGVQDLTYNPSLQDEADARTAHHSQDCAYEVCILEALRPGYRSLPLRSRSGCFMDMCCLYIHVSISDAEVETAAQMAKSDGDPMTA